MQESPMTVLDLFGGAGAFSLGLKEGSGCMKVTHALEISPSAAKTIRYVLYHFFFLRRSYAQGNVGEIVLARK
jgi:site-specific DNA-cytosine methylase